MCIALGVSLLWLDWSLSACSFTQGFTPAIGHSSLHISELELQHTFCVSIVSTLLGCEDTGKGINTGRKPKTYEDQGLTRKPGSSIRTLCSLAFKNWSPSWLDSITDPSILETLLRSIRVCVRIGVRQKGCKSVPFLLSQTNLKRVPEIRYVGFFRALVWYPLQKVQGGTTVQKEAIL